MLDYQQHERFGVYYLRPTPVRPIQTTPTATAPLPEEDVKGSSKIAFFSDRDGNSELYVINFDGRDLTRFTDRLACDFTHAWSPEGGAIAFHSSRDDSNTNMFVMSADGSNQVRLTHSLAFDEYPSWAPGRIP